MLRQSRRQPAKKTRATAELAGGVVVSPVPITLGERVTVKYHGSLARAGQVYLHYGYGPADRWQSVTELPMRKEDGSWEVTFPVAAGSRLNFCFRDEAFRWDNNGGRNWSFEVHTGERPS